jgi:hypothetical protein
VNDAHKTALDLDLLVRGGAINDQVMRLYRDLLASYGQGTNAVGTYGCGDDEDDKALHALAASDGFRVISLRLDSGLCVLGLEPRRAEESACVGVLRQQEPRTAPDGEKRPEALSDDKERQ